MPDKRTHRGPHPKDQQLFAPAAVAALRKALADFSLLLSKGYADKSALKLVGDRYALTQRQRLAIMRSACSDRQLASRTHRRIPIEHLPDRPLAIDGYNLLITIEAAISGAVIFAGRDGCFRDLAGIHGTYRKVTETVPAVELIGRFLEQSPVQRVRWLLDSPVSNSGRLKKLIAELARSNNWQWEVELLMNPDTELARTRYIVVSSDSAVLDACGQWVNLAAELITRRVDSPWVIDLRDDRQVRT